MSEEEGRTKQPELPPGVILAPGSCEQTWAEKLYAGEVARGLSVTLRRLVKPAVTIDYDGTERESAFKHHTPREGYRGEHYLKTDEEGRVKCVACFMCAAACPAECIHIEAAPTPPEWKNRERAPRRFEIDLLRCIYCGMCEEACPVDAIALSKVYNAVSETREAKVWDLETLLRKGKELGLSASRHRYRPDGVPGAVPEKGKAGE
jgi:NADH-quinone oxidoreductase subunit I